MVPGIFTGLQMSATLGFCKWVCVLVQPLPLSPVRVPSLISYIDGYFRIRSEFFFVFSSTILRSRENTHMLQTAELSCVCGDQQANRSASAMHCLLVTLVVDVFLYFGHVAVIMMTF